MPKVDKKVENLFQYYKKNGFNHSTDEIVEGMSISRKTFFNRYKNKENSVWMVIKFWFDNIRERFHEKTMQCNHAVEELLQFGYEIHFIRSKEKHQYQYVQQSGLLLSSECPLVSILGEIIQKGINHYQFKEDVSSHLYAMFVVNNIAHYPFSNEEQEEIVRFLLAPIVTDRTKELMKELNFSFYD
ncbi:MAG: TetR/AcrR family transcriptional regulator [Bacteroidales bacterium]|nr:TetR/AcrR family transcriptional regulator [Bacteroidales bacterium]